MLIEPRASNVIVITTDVSGVSYQITDCDELGLRVIRIDHKDISVANSDAKGIGDKLIGSGFILYLK